MNFYLRGVCIKVGKTVVHCIVTDFVTLKIVTRIISDYLNG